VDRPVTARIRKATLIVVYPDVIAPARDIASMAAEAFVYHSWESSQSIVLGEVASIPDLAIDTKH